MVQVLQRTQPTFGERIGAGLEKGFNQGSNFAQMALQNALSEKTKLADIQRKKNFADQILNDPSLSNLPLPTRKLLANEAAGLSSAQATKAGINALREIDFADRLKETSEDMGEQHGNEKSSGELLDGSNQPAQTNKTQRDYDREIAKWQKHLSSPLPQERQFAQAKIDQLQKGKEFDYRSFQKERDYHTQFSKPIEEKVEKLRESLPKKENALNLARDAIETGDVGFFSKDNLAGATGIDAFRTAKGAQLITAGKENLLSNMSRTSARAQNLWFEQRLNSMFGKIGQSREANLTVQEMLEGELALDKLYEDTFDELSEEDDSKYGYVKKDIDKRVHNAIKDKSKEIFNRQSYRIRELEEQEMGLEKLRAKIGKNVIKGTPLTFAMAKLYKDKFGENALQVAKKNGYYIPTIEEFRAFRLRPPEFREGLSE